MKGGCESRSHQREQHIQNRLLDKKEQMMKMVSTYYKEWDSPGRNNESKFYLSNIMFFRCIKIDRKKREIEKNLPS